MSRPEEEGEKSGERVEGVRILPWIQRIIECM